MRIFRTDPDARGFTLVEVMAALGVFAIVTLGIVPLLGISLRSVTLSRSQTVGENAARDMMERIQGYEWFISWSANDAKVDVLDLFYPAASNTDLLPGQSYALETDVAPLTVGSGGGGVFTTVCPPPSGTNPACASTLPADHQMEVKAAFVEANAGTTPQTYQVVTPPSGYRYDSTDESDTPPAELMDVKVVVSWQVAGKTETFELQSIVGDRHSLTPSSVVASPSASPTPAGGGLRAIARLDYLVQVQNGFSTSTLGTGCASAPCLSELSGLIGNSVSTIEVADTARATSSVQSAALKVVRSYADGQTPPSSPPGDLASYLGAGAGVSAPPTAPNSTNCLPSPACASNTTISHPDFSNASVGSVGGTKVTGISADIPISGSPTTTSAFQLNNSCGAVDSSFTNPQADSNYLRLEGGQPYVRTSTGGGCSSSTRNRGSTLSTSTPLVPATSREVRARVDAYLNSLSMFKLDYGKDPWLLELSYFGSVECKASPNGGAGVTPSWEAVLRYHYDKQNNGKVSNDLHEVTVTMRSNANDSIKGPFAPVSTPNAIEWLKANNPLVYDGATPIYLFEERDANGNEIKRGYLASAGENKAVTSVVSGDQRTTSAAVDAPLRFDTSRLNASNPDTAYNVSVGKMSCEAVDNR